MVFFNHATRQMTAKIVYYGPGLCGKTTNLNTIYGKTSQKARGEMVSLNTETDRTLFFDLLPMDVGSVGGFKAKLQLYTVPGQVFYNSTRKLVLKGVDGIVFVVDSQVPMFDANRESLQNLEENLLELGMDIRAIPMVFQWNKRDLKNVVPIEQLETELNQRHLPSFQSIAQEGIGVFETLRGVTRLALAHIVTHHLGDVQEVRLVRSDLEGVLPPRSTPAPPPPAPPAPPEAPQALTFGDLEAAQPWDHTPSGALSAKDLNSISLDPLPVAQPKVAVAVERVPVGPPKPILKVRDTPAPPRLPALTPAIPKPKPLPPKPKTPTVALHGVSTAATAATPLKLSLPANISLDEVQIHVEIRTGGTVLGEATLNKVAPAVGSALKIALEVRRG